MIRILSILAVILIGCASPGIDDVNKRNEKWAWWIDQSSGIGSWILIGDEKTFKSGHYTLFYRNGHIYQKGRIENGMKKDTTFLYDTTGEPTRFDVHLGDSVVKRYFYHDGPFVNYYHTMKISQTGIVENHAKKGKWIGYYENGNKEYTEELINMSGWKATFYENGQMADSAFFIAHNIQHGQAKFWYESGQLKGISNWTFQKQDGDYTTYFRNGQLWQHATWKNGLRVGKHESWFSNGNKHFKLFYQNGLKEGLDSNWYENGKLNYIVNYKGGKEDGLRAEYYENGKLKLKGNFESGMRQGIWFWYNEKGNLYQQDTYKDDKLIRVDKI
jgi:antitoxin component YwqK of YwqJK toxin-antitoxin module